MKNHKDYPSSNLFTSFSSLTLFAGACMAIAPSAQSAENQSTSGNKKEETVIVRGKLPASLYAPKHSADPKFTRPVADTTRTMTIIPKKIIQDQQDTNLTDVLKNIPGVGAFMAGENGRTNTGDNIYMRGMDTSNSIYLDGIRDVGSIKRDTFNTESVEVIEGPSGSDYGRSAPSGSINIISKQPHLYSGIDASVSTGSAYFRRGTVDYNQVINDSTAFRINMMGEKGQDRSRDNIHHERYGIAPSVAFGLGTSTRLYLDYFHVHGHSIPDGGIPTIGLPGYSAPDNKYSVLNNAGKVNTKNFYGTESDFNNDTQDTATMRFEYDINDYTTLRNITRWSRIKQDYLLTSFTMGSFDAVNFNDANSYTISRLGNSKDQSNKILTNQTNITSTFKTGPIGHDVSAGIEFTRENMVNYAYHSPTMPAVNIYHPDPHVAVTDFYHDGGQQHGRTDTFGLYAFDTLALTSKFEINGGMRLDSYQTKYDSSTACGGTGRRAVNCPSGINQGTPVVTIDTSKSGNLFNWKAGALYHLTKTGNLYANYAVSQQPPGGSNFQLATQSSSQKSQDRTDFKPQRAKTYEIGSKWQLFEEQLLLSAVLFRTDISHDVEQNDDLTYSQYGKKRVQGYELSANGNITPAWRVMAGYTMQQAKIKAGDNPSQDGSASLPYTPKYALTTWTTYQLTDALNVGGGARYMGSMRRQSSKAKGTPDKVGSYWVADAMMGYKFNWHTDLQLNIYNLFNTHYVSSINKSGYRYYPGQSRTFMLTANVHF